MTATDTLPVTLLAGFLGSGKTTLVNRILSERHGEQIAVVVNEFGDVGIDGRLVVGASEDVIELRNGCLCCTLRGDLSESLGRLLRERRRRWFRRRSFQRVLIEASGLASPGPAVQTLLVDPDLAGELHLDGVLTLTHAAEIERQLVEHPEAAEQVGYADRLLLNHTDRADAETLAAAEAELRACNAEAEILRSVRAEVPVGELLDVGARRHERWRLAAAEQPAAHVPHTSGVGTVALSCEAPLDIHRLKLWLTFVARRQGQDVMRLKGVLRCANHRAEVVVQGVYQWLELGPGEAEAPSVSTLVLIGRDLDRAELERGWLACRAG